MNWFKKKRKKIDVYSISTPDLTKQVFFRIREVSFAQHIGTEMEIALENGEILRSNFNSIKDANKVFDELKHFVAWDEKTK